MSISRRRASAIVVALLFALASARAQEAIAVSESVAESERTARDLRDVEGRTAPDPATRVVEEQLPATAEEIRVGLEEMSRRFAARPSLETIRETEAGWNGVARRLGVWKRDLAARASLLETDLAGLARSRETWSRTLEAARTGGVPPEVLDRAAATLAQVEETSRRAEAARAAVLALQTRVSEQEARVGDALATVERVRGEAVGRLTVRDSPPLWRARADVASGGGLAKQTRDGLASQVAGLGQYLRDHSAEAALHALVFLALVAALVWARRRVRPWARETPDLAPAALVFELPVATALVVAALASGSIYSQPPRMLMSLFGAAALVPTVVLLRRLLDRRLLPALYALVGFYFVDLLTAVLEAVPAAARLGLLVETLGGLLVLGWLARPRPATADEGAAPGRAVRTAARAVLPVFAAALVANVLGYVSLARLVVGAVLVSAYTALIFFAAVRIVDGLVMFALRVRPLALLAMVRSHRRLIRRRVVRVVRWAATIAWALITLEMLTLRAPIVGAVRGALAAELAVGSIRISLGDVVAFVVVVWLAFLLSRLLRFVLDEEVFPRTDLGRGVPYAVSTLLHYAVLLVGFAVALGAVGIDMTRFTILAGAFGVGLGFGLQQVVNNFVSGLILLFERPVKVGDLVQVGEHTGHLTRIGLRASVVRTWEGAEVIVPNGELISAEVVNWTLSDQRRRVAVDVGVAYGTEPERVVRLLVEAALRHPEVLAEPPPEGLFVGFGDNAMTFQLRAWIEQPDRWLPIKSELTMAVNAALRDAGVEIPFPQIELRLPGDAPDVERVLAGDRRSKGD